MKGTRPPKRPDPTGERKRKRRAQREEALRLYRHGKTVEQIARELDMYPYRVRNIIAWSIKKAAHIDTSDTKAFLNDQLHQVLQKAWPEFDKGNMDAGRVILTAIDRAAKMTGVDAPVRAEVTGKDGGPIQHSIGGLLSEIDGGTAGLRGVEGEIVGPKVETK